MGRGRTLGLLGFTAALLLGASWLLFGPWLLVRDGATPDAGTSTNYDVGVPGLAGRDRRPQEVPAQEPVVDPEALLRALEGKDPQAQAQALNCVEGTIPYHERLARLLLSLLEVGKVHWHARQALARMQPAPIETTYAHLDHPVATVRAGALYLLSAWRARGDPVPRLPMVDLLGDADSGVRQLARSVAAVRTTYDEALAQWLLDQIQPGDRGPEWAPERILGRMGPEGLAHLVALLENRDTALRLQALWGLASARAEDLRPHREAIGAAIRDQDMDVRLAAVQALRPLEGDCEACLPALIEALEDESTTVALAALGVIAQMGTRAVKAVPTLVALARGDDLRTMRAAAGLLGTLKVRPEIVLPALTDGLSGWAGDASAAALAQFGPAALPYALKVLDGSDDDARFAALLALGLLGPAARDIAPRLAGLIRGEDVELAQRALWVAGRVGPEAAVALPAILQRLWEGRLLPPGRSAAVILMGLGPGAEQALRAALRSKDAARRAIALGVVQHCYGRSEFAFVELEALLKDPDALVRRRVVDAICVALGDEDGDVVVTKDTDPALRARVRSLLQRVVKDEDWLVRDWANDAIAQIDALQKG